MAKRGRRPETATERFQRAIEARRELDKELKEMQRKGDPPSQQRGIDIVSRRLRVRRERSSACWPRLPARF